MVVSSEAAAGKADAEKQELKLTCRFVYHVREWCVLNCHHLVFFLWLVMEVCKGLIVVPNKSVFVGVLHFNREFILLLEALDLLLHFRKLILLIMSFIFFCSFISLFC